MMKDVLFAETLEQELEAYCGAEGTGEAEEVEAVQEQKAYCRVAPEDFHWDEIDFGGLIERPQVEPVSIDEDGNLRDSYGNILEEDVDYEDEPDEEIQTEEEILMENDPFLENSAKEWEKHFFSEEENPVEADWLGQENFFDDPDIRAVPIPDWEEKIDRLCGEGREAKTFLYEELREARRTAERVLVIAELAWKENKEEVTTQMANLIVTLHNVQRACSALDMFPSPAHAEDKKRLLDTYGLELAL